jgi:hypothetical protein
MTLGSGARGWPSGGSRRRTATSDALLAMVRGGDGGMAPLVDAVRRYAPRVPDAAPALLEALPTLAGGALGLAFYALATAPLDDATTGVLVDHLRDALNGSDEAAVAAAQVIALVGAGSPRTVWDLAGVLDRDDAPAPLRHAAVYGLVDLLLAQSPPSPGVRARLEREARQDTDEGKLARWFLDLRPIFPVPVRPPGAALGHGAQPGGEGKSAATG